MERVIQTQPRIVTISNRTYQVDARISAFSVLFKASSNIDFYGIDHNEGRMFFQFRNGTTYKFTGVPGVVRVASEVCESIGKFFFAHIKGKYPSEGVAERMVTEVYEEQTTNTASDGEELPI